MSNLTGTKPSGIFIDLENMAGRDKRQGVRFELSCIMTRVGSMSTPILRKAYGNWQQFDEYHHDFVAKAFDLVQLFSTAPSKNGLDIQIAVDAMEAIFLWPQITTIFLVTGDSDYCPLVRMLRKHGRRVIGIGWSSRTGKTFPEQCDEFWPYDNLIAPSHTQNLREAEGLQELLDQVTAELGPGQWVNMALLKNRMLHYDPTFDEKLYGFTKFSDFVAAHPDLQSQSSPELSNCLLVRLPKLGNVSQNGKH